MLSCEDYRSLDGVALAEGLRKRQISSVEAVDCAITLAEQINPKLNAITEDNYEQARQQAVLFDKRREAADSPIAGIPFLLKDIGRAKGFSYTHASRLFAGECADHDAAIVRRFKEAGLIILGKTNTPELCLTITTESKAFGPCRNPWQVNHSTGGSSGGSAAAVASGIVPFAHASDGGGSIRIPASCCGVVGLKPSRGLTPVDANYSSNWSGMSVSHVVSRSVRDSALMLDTLKLDRPTIFPLPPTPQSYLSEVEQQPRGLKIALQRRHPLGSAIHPEVLQGLDMVASQLSALGYEVEEAVPPVDYQKLAFHAGTVINTHVAETIIPQLAKRGLSLQDSPLEEATRRMSKRGSELTATDFLAALDGLRAIELQMQDFHQNYAVLLSPVLSQPPAELGWLDMDAADIKTYGQRFSSYSGFAALFNATGQPSISLPLHHSRAGLPIGIMLSAAWGNDLLLLQLAALLEKAMPWAQRKPAL